MLGAMKMMAMATMEMAAASVGESRMETPVGVLEEKAQVEEVPEAPEEKAEVPHAGHVEGACEASAALEEAVEANGLATEAEMPVMAAVEEVATGAVEDAAQETGEEMPGGVQEATPEPAAAVEEEVPPAEETSSSAITTEGEVVDLAEELADTAVEQAEAPVITSLAAASTTPPEEELVLLSLESLPEPLAVSEEAEGGLSFNVTKKAPACHVLEAVFEESAAPPAGMEAQVVMAVLEDATQAEGRARRAW
ncbi:hypothetical protein MATL_G00224980 [Megalops atlanticus]|uniref:Uncharacterized protein n=1 Tax=Megalops atlanticus TaxID=7932 RepID=A0A9D3T381_MEGAT|nr:hypothetical protein MATL_G00224980 [Megalops atlanticus]